MRYLAIDWGEKRIGLAVSDPTRTIAQPLKTLPNKGWNQVVQALHEIIDQQGVCRVVVGLPRSLANRASQKTREVAQVIENLRKALPVPVVAFDERLTTVLAERTARALGKQPSRHREKLDQLAAVHLLQNYLDLQKKEKET